MARKPEAPADAGIGHNSGDDSPAGSGSNLPGGDMTEAIFLSAVRRMDSFDEAIAGLNLQRNRFRKELKSRGFKLRLLDMVRGERDLDRKEVRQDTADLFKMRRWLQIPVGTQAELFPKEAETPSADAAYAAGYQAGVSGKAGKPTNDFTGSTESWMKGWGDGQAKIAVDMFGKKDYTKDVEAKPGKAAGPASTKKPTAAPGADNVVSMADAKKKPAEVVDKDPLGVGEKPPADPVAETVKRVAAKGKGAKDKTAAAPADTTKPKARPTQDPSAVVDNVRKLAAQNEAKEAAVAPKPAAPTDDELDDLIEEEDDDLSGGGGDDEDDDFE